MSVPTWPYIRPTQDRRWESYFCIGDLTEQMVVNTLNCSVRTSYQFQFLCRSCQVTSEQGQWHWVGWLSQRQRLECYLYVHFLSHPGWLTTTHASRPPLLPYLLSSALGHLFRPTQQCMDLFSLAFCISEFSFRFALISS